jgi:two-component system response regulator AtoC
MVEYAVNVCDSDQIDVRHLPSYITEEQPDTRLPSREEAGAPAALLVGSPESMDRMNWSGMEKRMILEALVRSKGRKGKAADLLGWGRSTLWRKMKEYDIES